MELLLAICIRVILLTVLGMFLFSLAIGTGWWFNHMCLWFGINQVASEAIAVVGALVFMFSIAIAIVTQLDDAGKL